MKHIWKKYGNEVTIAASGIFFGVVIGLIGSGVLDLQRPVEVEQALVQEASEKNSLAILEIASGCAEGDLSGINSNAAVRGCWDLIYKSLKEETERKSLVLATIDRKLVSDSTLDADQAKIPEWLSDVEKNREGWCQLVNITGYGSAIFEEASKCNALYQYRIVGALNDMYDIREKTRDAKADFYSLEDLSPILKNFGMTE